MNISFRAGFAGVSLAAVLVSGFMGYVPPTTAQAVTTTFTSKLMTGSTGPEVSAMQEILREQGYLSASPTGYFGPLTREALGRFQIAYGFEPVGYTGPLTRAVLTQLSTQLSESTSDVPTSSMTLASTTTETTTLHAVSIPPPDTIDLQLTADHTSVSPGSSVTLAWTSTGLDSCHAKDAWSGPLPSNGSQTVTVSQNSTYSISCSAGHTRMSKSVDVQVMGVPDTPAPTTLSPIVSFTANASSVTSGGSVTLTWSSTGAASCAAHNSWSGTSIGTSGSKTFTNLTSNQTYTITCTNTAGTTNKSVSVTVVQPTTTTNPIVTSEGDSISVYGTGMHVGIYAANHPNVSTNAYAVGGSTLQWLEGIDRLQRVLDSKPKVFTVLIGANDLGGYDGTAAGWHKELLSYLSRIRPTGAKILVGTLLPQCNRPAFNGLRDQANALIRADYGTAVDGVIDFAADPAFDETADGCNTTNFSDYVHPSGTGQKIMAGIYTKAVDAVLAGQTAPPSTAPGTLTFAATTGTNITPGGSVTLSWTSTGASSCTASGSWTGSKAITGTYTVININSNSTYTLSCTGSGGTVSKSVAVYVSTGGLGGATPIPSNFDDSLSYDAASIPDTAGSDPLGAFRFTCGAGQVAYDDPIVFPGQPGKSHLHQFYGNTAANAYSTYESLRTTGGSTCNTFGDESQAANRSAYWMPAMLDGKGNVVKPDLVSIYYKRRPVTDPVVSDPSNPQYEGKAVPLPNGLKFIFGYDFVTGKASTGAQWFNCTGSDTAVEGHYNTIAEARANCPVNPPGMPQNQLIWRIVAPNCWDGKNLDSANHRDHVAYAGYGDWGYLKCDAAHPYVIPNFELGAEWTVDSNLPTWRFASDEAVAGVPAGTTGHADFFMAWSPAVRDKWENGCINKRLNCSSGNMGDGTILRGAAQPLYWINGVLTPRWLNPYRLVPVPTKPIAMMNSMRAKGFAGAMTVRPANRLAAQEPAPAPKYYAAAAEALPAQRTESALSNALHALLQLFGL